MSFVALDPTKLIVLMIAGGGFALAGLWLMFRPKSEGGAAKLELFGMKFEASSAGLLVFLIGAGFLAVPLFVPEKQVDDASPARSTASTPPAATGVARQTTVPAADRAERPSEPSRYPDAGTEVGPEGIASAIVLSLGDPVSGQVSGGDADIYSVAIPAEQQGEVVASLVRIGIGGDPSQTWRGEGGDLGLTLFDKTGAIIGHADTRSEGTATVSGPIASDAYRVVVHSYYGIDAAYSLTIGVRQ